MEAMQAIIIWAFCAFCYIRTEQELDHEDTVSEYYRCNSCGHIHSYKVR